MATINLGKLVYQWRGDFDGLTAYQRYDTCRYLDKVYICTEDTLAGEDPVATPTKWDIMTEGASGMTSAGDLLYHNGTQVDRLPVGVDGQTLVLAGGLPSWGTGYAALSSAGLLFSNCFSQGISKPTLVGAQKAYANQHEILDAAYGNLQVNANGRQIFTVYETGTYLLTCAGAAGGGGSSGQGDGGIAVGTKALTAGDLLYITIGQIGTVGDVANTYPYANQSQGSFGDGYGGSGGTSTGWSGAGGGGTGIRLNGEAAGDRIIVAGAGGGTYIEGAPAASHTGWHAGGSGGGDWGGRGEGQMGTADGARTSTSTGNASGNGGTGNVNDAGGGGGGYFGGPGGGDNGGGAGGSGYIGGVTDGLMQLGGNAGNGWVRIQKIS